MPKLHKHRNRIGTWHFPKKCQKKMYPKSNQEGKDLRNVRELNFVKQYEPPVFKENKAGAYIEFKAFDPATKTMKRKTVKLNHIKGNVNRRKYAKGMISRINSQLEKGWNPWICKDTSELYLFEEALTRYGNYIEKMYSDGLFRKETYAGYKSYLKNLREYNRTHEQITYLYQFDRQYCSEYLDYVFIERNCCAQTRNNYLGFLKTLSGFMIEKGLIKNRPTDGIKPISKRLITKERDIIPTKKVKEISEYLREKDPQFLLACYLLYYCFIRPVEMTRLRIGHINIKESTITLNPEDTKNKKCQTVTIPTKVLHYMIDIGLFKAPMKDYIFSAKLMPGREQIDPKIFRDHWEKLRKVLKMPKSYKFYSLKDTGITELLESNVSAINVRDQARHSTLQITDIYTSHSKNANPELYAIDGSL